MLKKAKKDKVVLTLRHGVTRRSASEHASVGEQVLFHSAACFSERAVSMIRDSSNHQIGSFRARMETSLAFSSPDKFKVSWEIAVN